MKSRRRIAGLGEVLWDDFPDGRRPGGATSNVAFHASQLGADGFVVSRVGDDADGREIVQFLRSQGLNVEAVQVDDDAPTGTVTVDMSDAGHPLFVIHEDVAWDRIQPEDSLRSLMPTLDAVCFGTLAQRSPQSRETIQNALFETRDNCLIVFDVNIRQHFYDQVGIERSLQSADVVKLNDSEVDVLSELLAISGASESQFAAEIRQQFGVELVCITRAERGCFLADAREHVDLPGRVIPVADAVGAGDAFTAALIVAQLERWSIDSTADFANRVGALVASHPGGMPVLAAEFQQLKIECRPD